MLLAERHQPHWNALLVEAYAARDSVEAQVVAQRRFCRRQMQPPIASLVILRYDIGYRCAELIANRDKVSRRRQQSRHDVGFRLEIRQSD